MKSNHIPSQPPKCIDPLANPASPFSDRITAEVTTAMNAVVKQHTENLTAQAIGILTTAKQANIRMIDQALTEAVDRHSERAVRAGLHAHALQKENGALRQQYLATQIELAAMNAALSEHRSAQQAIDSSDRLDVWLWAIGSIFAVCLVVFLVFCVTTVKKQRDEIANLVETAHSLQQELNRTTVSRDYYANRLTRWTGLFDGHTKVTRSIDGMTIDITCVEDAPAANSTEFYVPQKYRTGH